MHTKFWLENLKGKHHLKELGIDGKAILEWILKNGLEECGLESSEDRDQWQAVVNMVMNIHVPQTAGNLTSWVTNSFSIRTLFHEVRLIHDDGCRDRCGGGLWK
jgi:hypothetical protein